MLIPAAFVALLVNEEMNFIKNSKKVEEKQENLSKSGKRTPQKCSVKILTSMVASPDEIASAVLDAEKRESWDSTILSAKKD